MHTDFLIIGQGICGTFLSWYLQKAGYSFMVIDDAQANAPSKVAAGVINPVTGRRIVKTWLIDEVMPFAWQAYTALGNELGVTAIEQKNIIDFFPTPQMKMAFEKKYAEDPQYLSLPKEEHTWQPFFQYDFGYGEISPAYLVNLPGILPAYRKQLLQQQRLRQEHFDPALLQLEKGTVQYQDLTATYMIFCDGMQSAELPWFKHLPFAPNKGEAVLVNIPHLPTTHIFKRGFSLVPWQDTIFWLGATYLWDFTDTAPTPSFKQFADTWLKQTVRQPFEIIDHKAGVRPATLERRPFVGFHPLVPQVGLLNGMGTKGCSLGPWFASQLVAQLQHGTPIAPEAGLQRFRGILSRSA